MLRSLPLAFAALVATSVAALAPAARADCNYLGEGCKDDREPEDPGDNGKPEVGVGLDVFRLTPTVGGFSGGAELWGLRASMHARLGRRVALGVGMEPVFGTDASGYKRYDLGWTLPDVYLYLTPLSRFQLYTVMGMDMRVTHFDSNDGKVVPADVPWGHFYFGGSAGVGIEHRMTKYNALRVELRGFVRGRLDGAQMEQALQRFPEFYDSTRTTKGAMLSIGMVFF